MASHQIRKSEADLIIYLENKLRSGNHILSTWEKKFCRDIFRLYGLHNDSVLLSTSQIKILLRISEKVI